MTNFKVTITNTLGKVMQCCFTSDTPQAVLKQIATDDFTTAEYEPERGERFGKVEAVHKSQIAFVEIEEMK